MNDIPQFQKLGVRIYFDKKKYNFGNASAAGSSLNGYYFTEGINKIQALTRDSEKVLILDEDSFFTTGRTIQFLLDNNFDLACGYWPAPPGNALTYSERPPFELNASIIAINSKNVNKLFPIVEKEEYVEILLGHELFTKVREISNSIIFELQTRRYTDYGGDGLHTNNIETIKEELTKANIPYE
jgi:hypothetical protein